MVSESALGPLLVTRPVSPGTAIAVSTTWLRRLRSTQVYRLWLTICVVALLVLVGQYHVSSSWQSPGHLSADGVGESAQYFTSSEVQDAVRAALRRLVSDQVIDGAVEARILHEVWRQTRTSWPITDSSVPPPDSVTSAATATVSTSTPTTTTPCPPTNDWLWPALRQGNALSGLPTIYIVTPTYSRPEQVAELTRLGQTLRMVQNVHWLVVEDSKELSPKIDALLQRIGVPYTHFNAPMPDYIRLRKGAKPKGVAPRNRALKWIRANAANGTVYFADDDNTYDIALFEEMRWTKKVSMWPVGLCTKFGLSTPVVAQNGTFTGFYDGWIGGRKFPVDMAGFAVSISFLHERPKAHMPLTAGYEEDGLLRSLAPFEPSEIELKADNCTKILVWHTQTKSNPPSAPMDAKFHDTNIAILKKMII